MQILIDRVLISHVALLITFTAAVLPRDHCFAQKSPAAETARSLADELPRIPSLTPEQALQAFEVQQGFTLELVAAEPDVADPVDACFDETGRMFVAEMHGYPFSQEPTRLNPKGGGKPDAGIVRLLEDTNGDGRPDRSTVFADDIRWPTSVICWDGGVFVLAPPNLWYFKDTDGDGVADERRVIFEGFNRDNVQAIANNLKWGLDGRIYGAGGRNPSVLTRDGQELLKLGRVDFSFDPRQLDLRAETGGVQFGHSFDDWGNRFVCSNSNHIRQVVYPTHYLNRNPDAGIGNPIPSISKEGSAAPVFRRSSAEPWRIVRTRRRVADPRYARLPATEKVPIGFFTSATGITIYRGAAWPDEFSSQVFIGDVGGNLIHRKTLAPNGPAFLATRADQNVEFITSTDNWFRPVNFVNAPDGTLYVLDMYRETIEHPYSIPEDIKEHLDLEGGDTRGRIYRIVGPNGQRLKVTSLADLSMPQLIEQLNSRNGWNRETAHRLLLERRDPGAVLALQRNVKTSDSALGRMHSLWLVSLLSPVDSIKAAATLTTGLNDADSRVRRQAAVAAEAQLRANAKAPVLPAVLNRCRTEDDAIVQFQLALSLGESPSLRVADGLTSLLERSQGNRDVNTAVLTSVRPVIAPVVANVLSNAKLLDQLVASGWFDPLLRTLQAVKGTDALVPVAERALQADNDALFTARVLFAVDGILKRKGGSLTRLLNGQPQLVQQLDQFLAPSIELAADSNAEVGERQSAAHLLALADTATAVPRLSNLLEPTVPARVQLAAVSTLGQFRSADVESALISKWNGLSPAVRNVALGTLTATVRRVDALLTAIEAGTVRAAELSADRRQFLLNHPTAAVKARAEKVLGSAGDANRKAIVVAYGDALDLSADVERGRAAFVKKCSICHKLGDVGHNVGPDIVSVQNKSPDDLLIAILDPNREAQPNFTAYNLITTDGRVLNGIIVAESAASITLRRAEGKEDIVPRSEIDQLVSSGRTLMPEGLEKDVSKQDIADLIAFIKSLRPPTGKPESR
ncbi:MAG: PVC-type heme-binding CxxCH protein [Planctomycetota bacterium]|jgi:putative membrane-bound dehydrogenase-like protein